MSITDNQRWGQPAHPGQLPGTIGEVDGGVDFGSTSIWQEGP